AGTTSWAGLVPIGVRLITSATLDAKRRDGASRSLRTEKQTSWAVTGCPSVKKMSWRRFHVQVVCPAAGLFCSSLWLVVIQSMHWDAPPGCVWHKPPVFGFT